tara:strand:- start:1610 stop:1792 length:183 start_codon:yes stop_codon:yes gene_type:complete
MTHYDIAKKSRITLFAIFTCALLARCGGPEARLYEADEALIERNDVEKALQEYEALVEEN